jgi:hypothetical protein
MSTIILAAKGNLDQHLIGNPQISFFKVVYRRHTNFSMQPMQIPLEGTITESGGYFQTKISRSGDLLNKLWFDAHISASNASAAGPGMNASHYFVWTRNTGAALIKDYSLQIGQQIIDKQDSDYLNIVSEVYDRFNDSWISLNKQMLSNKSYYNASNSINNDGKNHHCELQLYIDLQFWFCKKNRPPLPVIAIQNQDITLNYNIRNFKHLINASAVIADIWHHDIKDIKLYGNYIHLDTDERRRFVQTSHEYLIEQIQYFSNDLADGTNNIQFSFNNPVKQLFWFIRNDGCIVEATPKTPTEIQEGVSHVYYQAQPLSSADYASASNVRLFGENDYFNWNASTTSSASNVEVLANHVHRYNFKTADISVNDVKLFNPLKASYFEYQTFAHADMKLDVHGGLFMYSFALRPGEYQPTGTFNMTHVDRCTLNLYDVKLGAEPTHIKVYAINYNILRVMSGMAALAYIN